MRKTGDVGVGCSGGSRGGCNGVGGVAGCGWGEGVRFVSCSFPSHHSLVPGPDRSDRDGTCGMEEWDCGNECGAVSLVGRVLERRESGGRFPSASSTDRIREDRGEIQYADHPVVHRRD